MGAPIVRKRVTVSGRVQGVFFRQSMADEAASLGVAGWVRNRDDGRVEAVLEGAVAAVDQMVAWCGNGPPQAHVSSIEVEEEQPTGETGFRVR